MVKPKKPTKRPTRTNQAQRTPKSKSIESIERLPKVRHVDPEKDRRTPPKAKVSASGSMEPPEQIADKAIDIRASPEDVTKSLALRKSLKEQSPRHGELLYQLEVRGEFTIFQVHSLKFERLPIDRGRELFSPMVWVSGVWLSDLEEQEIPLPAYLWHCQPSTYPKIASHFVRALWDKDDVPNDVIGLVLIVLTQIANPHEIPLGEESMPHPSKGRWPTFDGDWTSIIRFANMLREHLRVRYFGHCYLSYPSLRSQIIAAINSQVLPPVSHAEVFIEACSDIWLRFYFLRETELSEVLRTLILKSSQTFSVYPCGDFEKDSVEKYCQLFENDKRRFLLYAIKSAKQALVGLPQIEPPPENLNFRPFTDEIRRAVEQVKRDGERIEETTRWCEIELEHLPVATMKSYPERDDSELLTKNETDSIRSHLMYGGPAFQHDLWQKFENYEARKSDAKAVLDVIKVDEDRKRKDEHALKMVDENRVVRKIADRIAMQRGISEEIKLVQPLFAPGEVWTETIEQHSQLIELLISKGFLRKDEEWYIWIKKRTDLAYLIVRLIGKAIHSESTYLQRLEFIRFLDKGSIEELDAVVAKKFGSLCRKIDNRKEDAHPSEEIKAVTTTLLATFGVPTATKNDPLAS